LGDNQGTVRNLIDDGGNLVEHLSYDSFGKLSNASTTGFRYGYTGREQDSETGLDYYRARYYDAGVGRFISEDPIGFAAGDSNIYRYVGNSPVNATDPSGNRGVPPRSPNVRPVNRPTINPGRSRNNPYNRPPSGYPYQYTLPNGQPGYTCVTKPGGTCDPLPPNPNCPLPKYKLFPQNELEIPWRDRAKWPKNCQLTYQIKSRPGQDGADETCAYICKEWGVVTTITRDIAPGLKCPQWYDYVPARIDRHNLEE
jgi:RHS repeat-associated protein